jgi:hypothetical protein
MKSTGDAEEFERVRLRPMSSRAEASDDVPTLYAEEIPFKGGEDTWDPLLTALVVLEEERVALTGSRISRAGSDAKAILGGGKSGSRPGAGVRPDEAETSIGELSEF